MARTAILTLGFDVHDVVDGNSLLHFASGVQAEVEMVKLLLSRGVSPDVRDWDGRTPLHWAASAENPDVCATLLEGGADVNAATFSGVTPLMEVVSLGQGGAGREEGDGVAGVVDVLLRAPAMDLGFADDAGNTAVDRAKWARALGRPWAHAVKHAVRAV